MATRTERPDAAAPTEPSPFRFIVTRDFLEREGVERKAGDIVDASNWPHGRANLMVEQRYLLPAPAGGGN